MEDVKKQLVDVIQERDEAKEEVTFRLKENSDLAAKLRRAGMTITESQKCMERMSGTYEALRNELRTILKVNLRNSGMEWEEIDRVIGGRTDNIPTMYSPTDEAAGVLPFQEHDVMDCSCFRCKNRRNGF